MIFRLRLIVSFVAFFASKELVSFMANTRPLSVHNVVICGLLIIFVLLWFNIYSAKLKKNKTSLFYFFYILLVFLTGIFSFVLRFSFFPFFCDFLYFWGLGVLPQALPASTSASSNSNSDSMTLIHYDPPAHSRPSAGSNSPISESIGNDSLEEEEPLPSNNLALNGVPMNGSLEHYRALNVGFEQDLIARIRLLEERMIPGIPPQLTDGEYEALVKSFLDNSISIRHYDTTLNTEEFDLNVLERKADLVEGLWGLLINEPSQQYMYILNKTALKEGQIKDGALDFIEDFLTRFNLSDPRSPFDRRVCLSMLNYWYNDLNQGANQSLLYTEFIKYYSLN